ncbi:MAG TPA: serine hydrolase [Pseudonocardia sp.]|nr:serine hydrolase [Pseudonocardia sp.]
MRQEPPARHTAARGRRWFLLCFTSVLSVVTVGASVLIVQRAQQASGEYYYPAATDPTTGTVTTGSGGTGSGTGTGTDSAGLAASGAAVQAAAASVDVLNAAQPPVAAYGVAVLDRVSGQLGVGSQGATPLFSASVVKLFTAVSILHRSETGGALLTDAQRADIQRALSLSDDNAMNTLWEQFGGPRTVTDMVALANLQDTRPPANPGEWGETLISARDVVAVYQYLLTEMTQADRDAVLGALASAQDIGADGFDQSFGLLRSPRPLGVAAKQGWMIDGPTLYLHSTGVSGTGARYVIALLSAQPASVGYETGRAYVSAAVASVVSALAGRGE